MNDPVIVPCCLNNPGSCGWNKTPPCPFPLILELLFPGSFSKSFDFMGVIQREGVLFVASYVRNAIQSGIAYNPGLLPYHTQSANKIFVGQ